MVKHSKIVTFYRKPAFVGLTFFGGTFFFLLQLLYWQRVYSKVPIKIIQYQKNTVARETDRKFKHFTLYESTARKILKAIGKKDYPRSLKNLEHRTGLDSIAIMSTLLHFAYNSPKSKFTVNLNNADSAVLEALPGIGGKTARKIIRYRERLGGFFSKYQLLEIKHLDSQLILENQIEFKIDTSLIRKICINECGIADLYRHPYIGKSFALLLWNYKKSHGFITATSIFSISSIPKEYIDRMQPYLDFRQTSE